MKGPTNLNPVGRCGALHSRDESKRSELEKTSTYFQNFEVERYWASQGLGRLRSNEGGARKRDDEYGTASVAVEARVEAMRNKAKAKHFESNLDFVFQRDPLEEEEEEEEEEEGREEEVIGTGHEEEEEENDDENNSDNNSKEEDKEMAKMIDELRRLRALNKGEKKAYKTWYFPPTNEFGSFLNTDEASAEKIIVIEKTVFNSSRRNKNNELLTAETMTEEDVLRENKRLEKAKFYSKSRNLETHRLW